GDEDGHGAVGALCEGDGTLGGEEPEAAEVADVVLVEEYVAGEPRGPNVVEQPLAALLELGRGDAGAGLGREGAHRHDPCTRPLAAGGGRGLASVDPVPHQAKEAPWPRTSPLSPASSSPRCPT